MVNNKILKAKAILIAAMFAISAAAVGLCISELKRPVNAGSNMPHKMTVVIDAGHGGIDGGVTGVTSGVKESELNLDVSKQLSRLFISAGFTAVLTRPTEAGLYGAATDGFKKRDMQKRKEIIEKSDADIVISVHMNKCGISSRRGAQVFYQLSGGESLELAEAVQDSLNGMEESVRTCITLKGDYYILNCSQRTSILVECGFLSNVEDEKQLLDSVYREKVAYAIFKGVISYLNR